MLTRRLYLLVITVVLIGVSPALAQEMTLLFGATFDDGLIPDMLNIQYGTHTITDGILSYSVENGGFMIIPEGNAWDDYAIEARMRITSGSVWLQARTGSDLCSGYYLTINLALDLYDLSMANADCDFTVFESRESADVPSDWLTARIEVVGNQIVTTINDEALFTATDDSYTVGYPTLNIFSEGDDPAQVEFDYIYVIDLSESSLSDVTPTEEPSPTAEATPTADISTPVEATPTIEASPTVDATSVATASVDLPAVTEVPLHDDPLQTIEMLQELGLIPTGVGELYQDNGIAISRIGAWFEPAFDGLTASNIVMSGDIRFLPYSDRESCLLSARIQRDEVGVAQLYLDVGINSRLEVFIGETNNDGVYSQATQDGLLTEPDGNILLVAYADRLSVFINGRAVFQNVEVTPREGTLGVSALSTTSFTVCHITDLWAYTFAD